MLKAQPAHKAVETFQERIETNLGPSFQNLLLSLSDARQVEVLNGLFVLTYIYNLSKSQKLKIFSK